MNTISQEENVQELTPRRIVEFLDRHIVGQIEAKKAVSIALRNRWRRLNVDEPLRDEILPKNILMIGATGVGKSEIARRLAKLVRAPFVKVEATKFTEIGYVGRDVEQIIRDLMEISLQLTKQQLLKEHEAAAKQEAEERILDVLTGKEASLETRLRFKKKLYDGELDDQTIEVQVSEETPQSQLNPLSDIPGNPGAQVGVFSLGDMFSQIMGKDKKVSKKMTIREAQKVLLQEESEKLIDQGKLVEQAKIAVEQNGIVFLDEIDKICATRDEQRSSSVSREGVQRDLLPLIEGTNVSTKYGFIKTDHILFIASGAFQIASPSDLLPELQGRLPIRVNLNSLTKDDFIRILQEPEANLIRQSQALLATEGIAIDFTHDAIEEIADFAVSLNDSQENIGARRLYTVVEKLLSDLSFESDDFSGQTIVINREYVREHLDMDNVKLDLKRFVL